MRKIEQDIITALRAEKDFKSGQGRDRVEWDGSKFRVVLWGNCIAEGSTETAAVQVSSCGYSTPTTTSRLNAVFAGLNIPMSVVIRKGELKYTLKGDIIQSCIVTAGNYTVTIS